jgi:hypothetical protein
LYRPKKMQEIFMARDDLGRWVPGTSGNPGGMPKPPEGLRTRLAELSPRAVERLAELLESSDERVRLEAIKVVLDRHLADQQFRLTSASIAVSRTATSRR